MYTKPIILKCLVFFVFIMIIMCDCEGSGGRRTKFGRKINSASKFSSSNLLNNLNKNDSSRDAARDFGSIFSLGKVLNFFPVGGERECQPEGFNVAKAGICLNPYDCRQRDGRAAGDCAHGLGVCCVFEVSCGGVVQNNLTYFLSPGFPELWSGDKNCDITIEKTHAGITQLKIDFIHFNIGQPNRTTGKCDEDAMVLGEGDSKFTLCGQNHGQHVYYTMSSQSETREDGDLPNTKATKLSMVMRATETPRLWLLRLAQLPLAQSAPHDCLQYHTDNNGTIKTFNFASNGRHLAGQEYKSCVRRNAGFCAIRYIPCGERSFRIDGDRTGPITYGGSGTVVYGQGGYTPLTPSSTIRPSTISSMAMDEQANANETMPVNEMPSPSDPENDEIEGSGSDPMIGAPTPAPANTNNNNGRSGRAARRWSPYFQHFNSISDYRFQYHGYGNFGSSLYSYGRIRCQDRITIPCENEYFVSSSSLGAGVCDPHHCGASLCPAGRPEPCRVESSITPFAVSVHFGPPTPKSSPEDNIGACLRYIQLPCTS